MGVAAARTQDGEGRPEHPGAGETTTTWGTVSCGTIGIPTPGGNSLS